MSAGLRIGHALYQRTRKRLPSWLFFTIFWLVIPPAMLVMMITTIIHGLYDRSKRRS